MGSDERGRERGTSLDWLAWFHSLDRDGEMRQFLEDVRAVVTQLDEEGRIVYVNSSVHRISGFWPRELIGMLGQNLVHPDDVKVLKELDALGPNDLSADHLYRTRRKDGTWAWVETAFSKEIELDDGSVNTVTFARDVTDLVQAGVRIRESEERYRMVVETSTEMITESDIEGNLHFSDGKDVALLGYSFDDLQRMPGYAMIHPDDRERVRTAYRTAFLTRTVVTHEPYRVQHRDGSWRWMAGRSIGYVAIDGQTRFLNVSRDISERIEHERAQRDFAQRTEQARRLESLGVLAGGIAHDFSNLLTPILGEANLALMDLPEGSPLHARLERIARSARRAADLTKQMLAYAGADAVEMEVLELSKLMDEVPQLIETLLSAEIEIEYELTVGLAPVEANAAQLLQVAMNLLSNAAEALGDKGGKITVRTGRMDLRDGAPHRFSYGSLAAGEYVYMEVEDDGCGMDEETRARIFDPFFTTKFTGRGLGLAAVLGIVRAHGGALDLDSETGRGTRFRTLLPVWKGGAAPRSSREARNDAELTGTVLVIDDDEAVVDIATETLRRAGLEVLGTTDASSGVELFRQHADEIRLVLLDRAMPGVSSESVFRDLRGIRADVSVLLISGYSHSQIATEFASEELAGFLQKPFLPEDLIARIGELLV